jgi:hypothetical protein
VGCLWVVCGFGRREGRSVGECGGSSQAQVVLEDLCMQHAYVFDGNLCKRLRMGGWGKHANAQMLTVHAYVCEGNLCEWYRMGGKGCNSSLSMHVFEGNLYD